MAWLPLRIPAPLEPGCLLHRHGLQRAGIGSVCISVFPIALHSLSLGLVGRPDLLMRGILGLGVSLLSELRNNSVSELVRVPADELRLAALPVVVVPRSQIAQQAPGQWAGLSVALAQDDTFSRGTDSDPFGDDN